MRRWVREDVPFLIARASGRGLADIYAMPAAEYAAWERHVCRGLSAEVWTPLLLSHLIEIVSAALGSPANLHRTIPWLAEDTAMRTDEQIEARRHRAAVGAAWHGARQALAAMRLRES